jgi:hypothetical protein
MDLTSDNYIDSRLPVAREQLQKPRAPGLLLNEALDPKYEKPARPEPKPPRPRPKSNSPPVFAGRPPAFPMRLGAACGGTARGAACRHKDSRSPRPPRVTSGLCPDHFIRKNHLLAV